MLWAFIFLRVVYPEVHTRWPSMYSEDLWVCVCVCVQWWKLVLLPCSPEIKSLSEKDVRCCHNTGFEVMWCRGRFPASLSSTEWITLSVRGLGIVQLMAKGRGSQCSATYQYSTLIVIIMANYWFSCAKTLQKSLRLKTWRNSSMLITSHLATVASHLPTSADLQLQPQLLRGTVATKHWTEILHVVCLHTQIQTHAHTCTDIHTLYIVYV